MKGRWLWLLAVAGLVAVVPGCVVETDCIDDNNNGICDVDEVCIDDDYDGICDDVDDCIDIPAGICDDICFYDGDADGLCDDVDSCIGDEGDDDGDGVCNGEDMGVCIDDNDWTDICADACTPITDNYCSTDWDLTYCAAQDGNWYYADCQVSCTTDEATWSQVCAAPALAGECSAGDGACLCWCEDSFDSCVEGTETVRYTRDGTTYDVDCKEFCFGTCDESIGACACP